MWLWFTILGMGIITYALRFSLFWLTERVDLPELVRRALDYVPQAVLSAIILPELLMPGGALDVSPGNLRLVAGLVAVLVARRTRNVLLTVGSGMATIWLLQAV